MARLSILVVLAASWTGAVLCGFAAAACGGDTSPLPATEIPTRRATALPELMQYVAVFPTEAAVGQSIRVLGWGWEPHAPVDILVTSREILDEQGFYWVLEEGKIAFVGEIIPGDDGSFAYEHTLQQTYTAEGGHRIEVTPGERLMVGATRQDSGSDVQFVSATVR